MGILLFIILCAAIGFAVDRHVYAAGLETELKSLYGTLIRKDQQLTDALNMLDQAAGRPKESREAIAVFLANWSEK